MPRIQVLLEGLSHLSANGDPKARRDLFALIKRHPGATKHQEPLRIITPDMSPQEASKLYAATLTAIDGLVEPDEG
jgi:hypothetical protein